MNEATTTPAETPHETETANDAYVQVAGGARVRVNLGYVRDWDADESSHPWLVNGVRAKDVRADGPVEFEAKETVDEDGCSRRHCSLIFANPILVKW